MTPQEESSPSNKPLDPSRSGPRRRSRRGGRGRRRGPRPGNAPAGDKTPADTGEPVDTAPENFVDQESPISSTEETGENFSQAVDAPVDEARSPEAHEEDFRGEGVPREFEDRRAEEDSEPEPVPEHHEPVHLERPVPPPRRDFRPASPAAVTEAIDEVNRSIASLREVLERMEEVLETLELAEIQKTADEREIRSLQDALRQMDRRGGEQGREGSGSEPARREPRGRDRRDRRR